MVDILTHMKSLLSERAIKRLPHYDVYNLRNKQKTQFSLSVGLSL